MASRSYSEASTLAPGIPSEIFKTSRSDRTTLTTMNGTILITGATGAIGQRAALELAGVGRVRAFVRNGTRASALSDRGVELAHGDLEEPSSLARAMTDIETLVLITPPGPNAADQAGRAIEAASAAGVRRIVRVSVIQPDERRPTDNVRQHALTDVQLQRSGIAFTILRPSFFMQNFLAAIPSARAERRIYFGMGTGRVGMVDVRDISDMIVAVTREQHHDGKIYVLTGPASLTFGQATQTLSRALGRELEYVSVTPEAVEQTFLETGADAWIARVLRDYARAYAGNWGDFVSTDIPSLLGRPARSFESFAREVFQPAFQRQTE
jgi:uncharacterized protein YbjT (DUF2867 family)